MNRLSLLLALVLVGCPSPAETSSAPTPTAATPADQAQPVPPGPPAAVPKGGDQLQREIGALNKKGLAIKETVTRYVEKNAAGGLLTVDNSYGGTDTVSFVRYHDPVREKPGKGYIVLSDFVAPDAAPGAFHTVAFWLKEMPDGYRVTEVVMQGHPEKRDGEWVRMEHFQINDDIAPPLK